ncbi:hypothetical protein [Streptomyces sp. AC627_RSS907]|uniref:hypothetical protein n=1 Tax=Streptomyces sp. AC627_RSS907 TaxID=2823684 RepID=UPI001C2249A5
MHDVALAAGDEHEVAALAGGGVLRAADLLVDGGHHHPAVVEQGEEAGHGQVRADLGAQGVDAATYWTKGA